MALSEPQGRWQHEMAPAPSQRRVRSLIPWRRATDAMVEDELRQRVALAEEQLSSRPRLATCGHYGNRVTRLARARGCPGRSGGADT